MCWLFRFFSIQTYAIEQTVPDKAISALSDVAGFDLSKFKIQLVSDQPNDYDGLIREDLTYALEANGKTEQVACTFTNDTLIYYDASPILNDSSLYAKPLPADAVDAAREVLQRYQIYSGTSRLQEAINVLDKVTEAKPANITVGDLRLQIDGSNSYASFAWYRRLMALSTPPCI